MVAKLESLDNWDSIESTFNLLGLKTAIEGLTYKKDEQRFHVVAQHLALHRFYKAFQGKEMTNHEFFEFFNQLVAVVEQCGASLARHPGGIRAELDAIAVDPDNPTSEEKKKAVDSAKQQYLAVASLWAADRGRYAKLIEDLENDYTKGNNNYPRTMVGAYRLLINYKQGANRP